MATTTSTGSSTTADIYAAINAANSASGSSSSSSSSSSTTKDSTATSQASFLKLLTTQLQNQDPMNPTDNAELTSQIAQINTASGMEKLNTTMNTLLSGYKSSESLQAASALLGHSVLVKGDQLNLSSGMAVGGFTLESAADKVVVSILDSSGKEVASETMSKQDAGSHDFVWNGLSTDGTTAKDGTYTMKITATAGKDTIKSNALEMATVTSVINSDSGASIDAGRFSKLALTDVVRIL
jgi:flagellar basal-body rod modification protein FlgD